MAEHFNKSDTMDLNDIMNEAYARRNGSAGQTAADAAARDAAVPAGSIDGSEDFVFSAHAAPRTRREPAGRYNKPVIVAAAVAGVLLIAGVLIFALTRSPKSDAADDAPTEAIADVAQNVVVSGINVGGMPYDQAMQALSAAEQKLADAVRIEVVCGDTRLTLTKDDFVLRYNTDEILRQAQQNPAGDYAVSMTVDESSYAAIAEKVASLTDRAAEDAKVESFNAEKKEMFTFREAVIGRKLNRDDLTAQLSNLIGGGAFTGTVEAKCDEAKPAVTAEYLKQNIKRLSAFTTESTNTANGMSNQALSLSACNSSVIEPGATWSFNNCTGDTNLESRGYLPASVIVQGRYETGIGGGICQSSTTIYNAALLCGMEVVERFEHAYPSSYVDYGRDATIDYPNLDLKLKNPFSHQLFLKCWMDGVILHAEVYGLPEKDFDEIRITTTAPVYGKTSYTVKASRTYYKGGKAVRTEALPSSTYMNYGSSTTEDPTTAPTTPPTQPATQPATDPPTTPTEPSENPGTDPPENPGTEPGGNTPEDPGVAPGDVTQPEEPEP